MLLRHFTTKEKLSLIINDGYLKSLKNDETDSEKGKIYFEEYNNNDFLLNFILSDFKYKDLTKNDFVPLLFDSNVLQDNDIKVELSTSGHTKVETEILIGTLYTKEEQSQIGDYYIVSNQVVPLYLCTDETKRILDTF